MKTFLKQTIVNGQRVKTSFCTFSQGETFQSKKYKYVTKYINNILKGKSDANSVLYSNKHNIYSTVLLF